jgi:mRNA interferase RelE/StbE
MSHEVIFTATARRDLLRIHRASSRRSSSFVFSELAAAPQRVGKPLERDLSGAFSARQGRYRVLCRIDEDAKQVTLLRVAHRAHVYRPAARSPTADRLAVPSPEGNGPGRTQQQGALRRPGQRSRHRRPSNGDMVASARVPCGHHAAAGVVTLDPGWEG